MTVAALQNPDTSDGSCEFSMGHLFPYQLFLHDSTILAVESSHRPISHFGSRNSIPPIFLPTFALALVQHSPPLFPVLG